MPNARGSAAVLLGVLGAACWAAQAWTPRLDADAGGIGGRDVPLTVAGEASGGDLPLPPEYKGELPGAQLVSRVYGTGPDMVSFMLVSGNSETALHDPRQCLNGWRLSGLRAARLPGTPIVAQTVEGARAGDRPDTAIAYFYVVNGRFISSPSEIRASVLGNALLGRAKTPIYFLRFMAPLGPVPADAPRCQAHLLAFAAGMWGALRPRILPPR